MAEAISPLLEQPPPDWKKFGAKQRQSEGSFLVESVETRMILSQFTRKAGT